MSEESSSGIQVGEQDEKTLLRVDGKGTHANSHLLKQYVLQCLGEKRHIFEVDLSRCAYMDSTFLGTLAGLGVKMKERSLPPIRLLNVSERIRGMLEGLGIDHLFELDGENTLERPMTDLGGGELDKAARSREMLEAHEKLAAISPANEIKFHDVIALLREKVRKADFS
ncbi:MAG: STAS domain-containing protein [Verrucomicrobia bacterium]|nr:STAS domain-containing protein [Verrucomicrobiota bacterium]